MKFGKRHYRPQVDQMDCGVASLAMVLATMVVIILWLTCENWLRRPWMGRRLWAWSRWQRRLDLRREQLRRI